MERCDGVLSCCQADGPDYEAATVWRDHQPLACCHAEVVRQAADTFEYLPKAYDPVFKNPCWRMENGELECMPYFQVLGVSKCGTTDFYNRLTLHPEVEDCNWKGPHFWDESVYTNTTRITREQRAAAAAALAPLMKNGLVVKQKYDGSFKAYVRIFRSAASKIARAPNHDHVTGEASSNTFTAVLTYLRGNRANKRVMPGVNLAHYVWEATPFARFFVLLRDPVTRYKSAFHYYRNRKKLGPGTPTQFHASAMSDMATWRDCLTRVATARLAAPYDAATMDTSQGRTTCAARYYPQQLIKGMYAEFAPVWLSVWPRSRFLFMRLEDLKAAPQEHVAAGFQFLGLRNLTAHEWLAVTAETKRNSQEGRYDDMLPETRALLQDFYRPFNARLAHFLAAADAARFNQGAPVDEASLTPDSRWLWGYA